MTNRMARIAWENENDPRQNGHGHQYFTEYEAEAMCIQGETIFPRRRYYIEYRDDVEKSDALIAALNEDSANVR